jgi:hypothetical protein
VAHRRVGADHPGPGVESRRIAEAEALLVSGRPLLRAGPVS